MTLQDLEIEEEIVSDSDVGVGLPLGLGSRWAEFKATAVAVALP